MRCRLFPLVLVFALTMVFDAAAFGTELKTEPTVVQLTGQFVMPKYRDVKMDRIGRYFALELDSPIDVASDKFGGPAKDVRLIQLILTGDPEVLNATVTQYKGTRVKVTGTLFYARETSHRTKVVLKVQKIENQYPETSK